MIERVDHMSRVVEKASATRESAKQTQRVIEQAPNMSESDKLTARVTEQARNPCEPVGQTDLQTEPDEQMGKI